MKLMLNDWGGLGLAGVELAFVRSDWGLWGRIEEEMEGWGVWWATAF
jgi:hypothetical protein